MSAPAARVRERPVRGGGSPEGRYVLEAWEARFPGLRAGVTAAGAGADFGLGTGGSLAAFLTAYRSLAAGLGFAAVAVGRQVHGGRVLDVTGARPRPAEGAPAAESVAVASPVEPNGGRSGPAPPPAVLIAGDADGLLCAGDGTLLTVTAADCVPVYLAAPEARVVGLLHAGWRGVAAGVLEAGLAGLRERHGVPPRALHVHLGVAICGDCYEVGPEVMEALGRPAARGLFDLRGALAARARAAGVRAERISVSAWCTACEPDRFHSHRGSRGTAGRMAAYLGAEAPS